jgi:hypothetical protein
MKQVTGLRDSTLLIVYIFKIPSPHLEILLPQIFFWVSWVLKITHYFAEK